MPHTRPYHHANAYYYKLDGFTYDVDGQTVTGESNNNFTWNARMQLR